MPAPAPLWWLHMPKVLVVEHPLVERGGDHLLMRCRGLDANSWEEADASAMPVRGTSSEEPVTAACSSVLCECGRKAT